MKKIILMFLMVLLVVSLSVIGCTKQISTTTTTSPGTTKPAATSTTSVKPKSGGTLRFIITELPQGSIGIIENRRGLGFWSQIPNETLLYSGIDGSFPPRLATSYEWSSNFSSVTFHLRQGVKFQDETDFNAAAVKWNWDMAVTAKMSGWDNSVSDEVIDNYTFRINVNHYDNTWLRYVGGLLMISPTAYQKYGAAYMDWHPVGTGPFKFDSYQENTEMDFVRFDDYWGNKPYVDALKIMIIADKVTAQIAFNAGQGDCMWIVGGSAQTANDLKGKGYTITSSPGMIRALVPSSGLPDSPFAKQKVREALEYAIDKVQICQQIGYNLWRPSYQEVLSSQGPYIANYVGRTYDPAKAKQLLTEAGYPTGFKTLLWEATQLTGDHLPAVQANLKAVGIEADAQVISTAKWADLEMNGLPEGIELSNHSNSVYGYYLHRFYTQPTKKSTDPYYWTSLYRPDELQKLITEYLAIPDNNTSQLVDKGKVIAKFLYDNEIDVPLWETPEIYYAQPYVHDDGLAKWGKLVGPGTWGYNEVWMDK